MGEPNDGSAIIEFSEDLLINDYVDPLSAIVDSTYPSILDNMSGTGYLQQRAILAPTNEIVDAVNEYMLSLIHGGERIYLSCDSTCASERSINNPDDIHTPGFLNTITASGLLNHILKLKIGVPVCC